MDDLFSEVLVQREPRFIDQFLKIFLIILTATFFVGGIFLMPLLLFVGLGLLIVDYFFLPKLSVEFEYSYTSGELDIDKIFSKQSRKRAASYKLNEMEIMAPQKSHQLDSYKRNGELKIRDFSSRNPEHAKNVFAFVITSKGNREMVLFEPDEKMLKDIRVRNAHKLFMD